MARKSPAPAAPASAGKLAAGAPTPSPRAPGHERVGAASRTAVGPAHIFDGPAILAFLALVVALAVYLRSISAALTATIETILADTKSPLWPVGSDHRRRKLELARGTRTVVQGITPVIFLLAIGAAARLLAWSLSAALPDLVRAVDLGLVDVVLAGCLLALVVAMFLAHWSMSQRERGIRREMEAWAAAAEMDADPPATGPSEQSDRHHGRCTSAVE